MFAIHIAAVVNGVANATNEKSHSGMWRVAARPEGQAFGTCQWHATRAIARILCRMNPVDTGPPITACRRLGVHGSNRCLPTMRGVIPAFSERYAAGNRPIT